MRGDMELYRQLGYLNFLKLLKKEKENSQIPITRQGGFFWTFAKIQWL